MNKPVLVRRDHVDVAGATVLILFSVLLGLNQALVKLVNVGFSPVFQSGLRSACAFFLVLGAALLFRRRLSLTDGSLWPGIASGVFFAMEFFLLFNALEYTTVSRVSVLFYTQPFWVAIGAHFLLPGEQMNRFKLAGLVLALSGVALLLRGGETGSDALTGDAMCIAASLFWAAIVLLVRKTSLAGCTPEMQLLYQLAVSAVLLLPIAPLFGDMVRDLDTTIVLIFSFQVVFVVSLGFLLWFWALARYPAADMAAFGLLAPVFGVFFGWVIFDDSLTPEFLGALFLVCAGLFVNNRRAPTA